MRRLVLTAVLVTQTACNPLGCFAPGDLPKDAPLQLASEDGDFPQAKVEVRVDEHGVPHIKGEDEFDAVYGMGFMQGRDRTFQLLVFKHAMSGRLTELFGEGMLDSDRYLRFYSYRSDEWYDALDERDQKLLQSFAAGVNAGARHGGGSAEMAVLGAAWQEWTPRDSLNIARYLQSDQTGGMDEELARARIVDRLPVGDPRLAELLVETTNGGVPVLTPDEFTGTLRAGAAAQTAVVGKQPLSRRVAKLAEIGRTRDTPIQRALKNVPGRYRDIVQPLIDIERGASNSWAVSGALTSDGSAVLANDPHLTHFAPSLWYIAHMEAPGLLVAGAAVTGLPFIGIGRGEHVAWGFTNAYADGLDLVEIIPVDGHDDVYWLDGAPMSYGLVTQRYQLGSGDGAAVVEETWKTTVFGPVVPPGWSSPLDDGHVYAMLWAPLVFLNEATSTVSALFDMAKAKTPDEAGAALRRMLSPSFSGAMIFDDGTIAYRQTGYLAIRGDDQSIMYPRNGERRTGGWSGALPVEEMPQMVDPAKGWINATNQRVVDGDGPAAAQYGYEGAQPWRAMRVDERIRELTKDGKKASPEDLLAIQQDPVHVGARDFAPALGGHCDATIEGVPAEKIRALCDAVKGFDGAFTKDSMGGLPYQLLYAAFFQEVLAAHLGPDVALAMPGTTFVQSAVQQALLKGAAGEEPALFDDPATKGYDGLDAFVTRAVTAAWPKLVELGGDDPANWRWGRLHQRKLTAQLASAPVIGMFWDGAPREQAGNSNTPRAEGGVPFTTGGASLRQFAVAKDGKLDWKMVIDTGQSGHVGTRHFDDMVGPWDEGAPLDMHIEDFASHVEGQVDLLPQ